MNDGVTIARTGGWWPCPGAIAGRVGTPPPRNGSDDRNERGVLISGARASSLTRSVFEDKRLALPPSRRWTRGPGNCAARAKSLSLQRVVNGFMAALNHNVALHRRAVPADLPSSD